MGNFRYEARTQSGQKQKGSVNAESVTEATKKLRDQDLIVLNLTEEKNDNKDKTKLPFGTRISEKSKIVFIQQLSIMIKAGLPITQALHSAADEAASPALKKIIDNITKDVEGGSQLSSAFAKYSTVFDQVFISVIRGGEKSGKIEEVLLRLSSQMEKDYDIKSKIKGALTYPAFVLVAMAVIVTFIMVYVIPQIQSVFVQNNAQLPALTVMIIGISNFMIHQWYFLIMAIVIIIFAYHFYSKTQSGRYNIDLLLINLPIFGNLIRKVSIARFARIFATLLSSGIPMIEIFDTSREVLGNKVFEKEITQVGHDVENGLELSAALKKQPHLPTMLTQLTYVGEKSGTIDEVYQNLADFMEKDVDNVTRNMTALLEPILMLIMGLVVGSIVVAVFLPIYSLTSSIS